MHSLAAVMAHKPLNFPFRGKVQTGTQTEIYCCVGEDSVDEISSRTLSNLVGANGIGPDEGEGARSTAAGFSFSALPILEDGSGAVGAAGPGVGIVAGISSRTFAVFLPPSVLDNDCDGGCG